ncbi:MAG: hypothetical protein IJN94_00005 [Clostridia bacterium]|nr:hypothetical protein [Clostridia bacterium]
MKIKKYIAVVLALLMVISLTSCKGDDNNSVTEESTTLSNDVVYETVADSVANTELITPDTTQQVTQSITQSVETTLAYTETSTDAPTQTVTETTEKLDDPSEWSTKRIVSEYKKAAQKSNSTAKSTQRITIEKMSVNDGEYESAMAFIKTIISKFLESNSTEKDGITGGFENLVASDVSSAKAYKSGNDTVIEMTMLEQTSGPKEEANSGSVGHAITAVGDISVVVKDLSDRGLPLELSEDETYIYYTNPTVKVTINENGEIISGQWQYTVEISMNNFKAFGQTVNKASIVMLNTITV